jgi:hypothetical protein
MGLTVQGSVMVMPIIVMHVVAVPVAVSISAKGERDRFCATARS